MNEMTAWQLFEPYFLAILLGALMGLERERQEQRLAGLRTFILVTLLGSICGSMGLNGSYPWMVPAGLIASHRFSQPWSTSSALKKIYHRG